MKMYDVFDKMTYKDMFDVKLQTLDTYNAEKLKVKWSQDSRIGGYQPEAAKKFDELLNIEIANEIDRKIIYKVLHSNILSKTWYFNTTWGDSSLEKKEALLDVMKKLSGHVENNGEWILTSPDVAYWMGVYSRCNMFSIANCGKFDKWDVYIDTLFPLKMILMGSKAGVSYKIHDLAKEESGSFTHSYQFNMTNDKCFAKIRIENL